MHSCSHAKESYKPVKVDHQLLLLLLDHHVRATEAVATPAWRMWLKRAVRRLVGVLVMFFFFFFFNLGARWVQCVKIH